MPITAVPQSPTIIGREVASGLRRLDTALHELGDRLMTVDDAYVPTGMTPTEARPASRPTMRDERPFREKVADFRRTIRLTAQELISPQHRIPDSSGLQKSWQRLLDRVLPGSMIQATFSEFEPNPAGDTVAPGTPLTFPVDPRAWMPKVHFEAGERFFPTDPGFDGDADVTNNPYTYRQGRTDGNQAPTFFVNARQRGEYTVITYRTYYADNQYMNRHHHDWEGFGVYLVRNLQGQLQPAYLYTSWHHQKLLIPWHELKLDASGRPIVTVDEGAHGTRPVLKNDRLNPGRTLHPNGYWEEADGRRTAVRVRLPGDAPGLVNIDPLVPMANGEDPRAAYFPSINWIAGFWKTKHTIGDGPRVREDWENPLHALHFRPRNAVSGEIVATIPPPPAA